LLIELKEAVRGIFGPGLSIEDVEVLIDRLLSRLARSRLEPFVRFGKTLRKHRDGILAAIRLGINQGRTEALNNKVRLITRRAYGFHSAKAARSHSSCSPAAPSPFTSHTSYTRSRSDNTDHIHAESQKFRGRLPARLARRRAGRVRRRATKRTSQPALSAGKPCCVEAC